MIHHVVVVKFKPGVSDVDIEELERILDDLPNRIIEIQTLEFGRDIIHSKQSCDYAVLSLLANPETLARCQQYPAYQAVDQLIGKLSERIVTVDFQATDAGSIAADTLTLPGRPFDRF
jgi:Stress responsive A/B Barrel Domain